MQSTGDPITDLSEDMAAEQKARTTYDNILRLIDDPDVIAPIPLPAGPEIGPLPAVWRSPPHGAG